MFEILIPSIVFSYSIFNIQLSNIIFYPYLIGRLYTFNGKLNIKKSEFVPVVLFILMSIISTISYSMITNDFNFRTIVQLIFTFQYLILCINLKIDQCKLEKKLIFYSRLLSFFIIFIFIYKGVYLNLNTLFTSGRLYGQDIIPGWPNSTALPLIFTTWIILKNGTKLSFDLILFSISSILTTSRMSIAAIIILWIYFLIIKPNKEILKGKINRGSIFKFAIVILILAFLGFILMKNESFIYRLGVTYDRDNIFVSTIEYIKKSPLIGYGGNTIAQLYGKISNNVIMYNWQHTHNAFLEIALRYGLPALLFFIVILYKLFKEQRSFDSKILFLILCVAL